MKITSVIACEGIEGHVILFVALNLCLREQEHIHL